MGNPAARHSLGEEARESLRAARAKVGRLVGGRPEGVVFLSGATEANNLAIKGVALRGPGTPRRDERRRAHLGPLAVPGPRHGPGSRSRPCAVDCRRTDLSRRRAAGPAARHLPRHPGRGQRRSGDRAAVASHRRRHPRGGRAAPRGRGGGGRAASHRGGDRRHRSPDRQRERPLRAAGCRRALGSARASLWRRRSWAAGRRAGCARARRTWQARWDSAWPPSSRSGRARRRRRASRRLRDRLVDGLGARCSSARLVGSRRDRLPQHAGFVVPGVKGESLVLALDLAGISAASGAACGALTGEPSHVLRAMGLGEREAQGALAFTLGRWTTADEVDVVLLGPSAHRRAASRRVSLRVSRETGRP